MSALLSIALLLAPQDDARATLEQAAAARAEATRVRYEALFVETNALEWRSWAVEGTVYRRKSESALGRRFRIEAEIRELRGEDRRRVLLVRNGERYVFVDHEARTYTRGDEALIGGEAGRLAYELLALFPEAPEEILAKGQPVLRGTGSMGGEPCRVVVASMPDGPTAHTWHVSARDGLPRLWETERAIGAGDSLLRRFTVRNLEPIATDENFPPQIFTCAIPEGYRVTEPVPHEPPAAASVSKRAALTTLADSLNPLREHFNAERGHTRVLGLFAPT